MSNWIVKIRKVGGSRVITLPADLIKEMCWEIGDELTLTIVSNDTVAMTKGEYQGTDFQDNSRMAVEPKVKS